MLLIDANVILRYILNDHDAMSAKAKDVVTQGACTTVEVLAEVLYLLSGVHKASRSEIHEWLVCLMEDIAIENKQAIVYALECYDNSILDFIDCVLLGYNHVLGQRVFTFDKNLNRMLSGNQAQA